MTFKSRKILLFFGVIWLLLGVVSLLPDMAFSEESVALTAEESQWIAGTPSITVGGEMDWAPFDFVGSDGTYQGLSRDVMDLVAQKTGLKLTYKTGQTWANLLKALEEGKLDVLPAIYHSEERAAFTIFTDPYFTVRDYVFMRDDAAPLTKIDDLANKKVAVIGGYVIIDRLQNQVPEMEFLEVNSLQEGVNAVLLGQADAYVDGYAVVSYHLAENMQTGLKPVLPIKGFNSPIRIGVSKQEPVLAGIVQKGLAAITSDEHRALRQKWFTSAHEQGANKQTGAKSTGQLKGTIDPKAIISRLSVSTKEQAWLNTKPTIRARVGQYPPYHFWDEEKGKGISADYLKHFCEGFGLNCVFFTGMPWVEAIDNIGAGKDVDLLLSIGGTRKLAGRVALTQTYLKPPRVIFTRKDGTFVREIDDLNGKTIAIERAYLMRELVSKNYPEIRQKLYPSTKTALEALSLGVVDAYIGLLPAASYIIDKEGYSNLKVAAPTPFGAHDHAMGVRKDWPELVSLLNSYFAVLLPEEKSAIRSKWLSVRYEYGIGLLDIVLWVGGVTLIALLIIGVIVYWNRRLGSEIEERKKAEKELQIARDLAEEATKAKASFLAAMSHEIRTPMNGVVGMTDLLQQTKLDTDQRQMTNTVRDSAYALLTIINDILDFSKIEAGKLDLEEIPVSIVELVDGVADMMAPNVRAKGIGIRTFVDPEIPDAVIGDQVRIRQILFNIAGNAVKFTESGKVFIRVDKLQSENKENVKIRFQVIDDGIGIPKEAQASLFQAFSQVDASTTRRFGGTGLGLTICQRLVEIMKGTIGVESEAGEGSTFSVIVDFPVAIDHDVKSDGHDLDDLNVLLALKDDDTRDLFGSYLEHWNAKTNTVGEIENIRTDALEAADSGTPYDVIGIGSGWEIGEQTELIKSFQGQASLASTKFVVAVADRDRTKRPELEGVVYVDADPMRRSNFIRSFAVATGRVNADLEQDENEVVQIIEAPSEEEAEAAGARVYGTHTLRRTKASHIYRKTGNIRAVQLLLGHTKLESTVRYLGIEVEDALTISEEIDF